MLWFQRNMISASIVKSRSNKTKNAALNDAKKQIKNGELTDSHDLALYLSTIDDQFMHLKTDIDHATRDPSYDKTRESIMTKTRKLLEFFSQEDAELRGLYAMVVARARDAGLREEAKGAALTSIDLEKLKASFAAIDKEAD